MNFFDELNYNATYLFVRELEEEIKPRFQNQQQVLIEWVDAKVGYGRVVHIRGKVSVKLWQILLYKVFALFLHLNHQIMRFESVKAWAQYPICLSCLQIVQFQMYSHWVGLGTIET